MRVLSTVKFTTYRMIRSFIVLLLLLVMPIALITVFSFVLAGAVTETGEPYLNTTALTMVLSFQLFGGSLAMSYIHLDFFTPNRKRIQLLPFNHTLYAFSITMCGTVYSIVLGVAIMAFSQFVLGVIWANWLWMIYTITLMSILSSVVCLIFTFACKNFKMAERLSEVYGVGFIVLAGLFFPMPNNAFFEFMGTYGNPLTLSMMSIEAMSRSQPGDAWQLSSYLLAAIVVLFIVMLALGRRRMA